MGSGALMCAVAMLRFLDPTTAVIQTDDPAVGRALASEPGYWKHPNGLVDPLAKKLQARVIHTCFISSSKPFAGYCEDEPSDLFKVSQVGYAPDAPKFAYLGAWLGPKLGAWKPRSPLGPWSLVDASSGETVYLSPQPPVLRVHDALTKEGTPFTGEETYEMDFSGVTREGTYFVRVPGVGRSHDFRISSAAAQDAFRLHMLGLYHKRCGIAKTEPFTHWVSGACHRTVTRGTFASDEGTISPKTKWFDIIRSDTDWEGGEKLELEGGWHDAADYDRRPMHLNIVNDLAAVYLMRPGNFSDGQLSIPECANGIPDILDEAEWGLRHLLAGQQPDGGVGTWIETVAHPVPGNVAWRDDMGYALAKATRRSSLMYAAHAALLARCHETFRAKYLDSAVRAWDFAMSTKPRIACHRIERKKGRFSKESFDAVWTEDEKLPSAYLVKAAVNLYALTGDGRYLKSLEGEMPRLLDDVKRNAWNWIPLLFSGERTQGYPEELAEFFRRWEKRTVNVANDILSQTQGAYAYRAPWWHPGKGWCHSMSWGQSHPLRRAQYLVAVHAMTGDRRYLDAAHLANDFHNGCNPQGTTLTSGLGRVYPVAFLDLPSYVDGIAEYVPGITPYRWNYGMPPKAVEMVWGGDKKEDSKWPIWRRWGNLENQTVAASEFTVWETIAPAASVTGYLLSPDGSRPSPLPAPAGDIRKLPGYWVLP